VTTDKPSVLGTCVRDKVPVCGGLTECRDVAGSWRGSKGQGRANSRCQLNRVRFQKVTGRASAWGAAMIEVKGNCLLMGGCSCVCAHDM
jgi:hypothetical protein